MPKQRGGEVSENLKRKLGKHIHGSRKKKKLTQAQLGAMIGVSTSTVCDWEKGRHYPSAEHLREIGQALEESTSFIVSDPLPKKQSFERLSRDLGIALGYNRVSLLSGMPADRLRRAVDRIVGEYAAEYGEIPKAHGVPRP